jgi:hypothetical protein
MSNNRFYALSKVAANNEVVVVPAGFRCASIYNSGSVNATLTQNETTFTVYAGIVFNFPDIGVGSNWEETTIDATGTVVECVYY